MDHNVVPNVFGFVLVWSFLDAIVFEPGVPWCRAVAIRYQQIHRRLDAG